MIAFDRVTISDGLVWGPSRSLCNVTIVNDSMYLLGSCIIQRGENMGGLCSKQSPSTNLYAGKIEVQEKQYSRGKKLPKDAEKVVTHRSARDDNVENENEIVVITETAKLSSRYANANNDDEFYDGIPRYQKSLYQKSRSLRVSEVSSLLSRASSVGLERAVEVLDTLGSSMTSLNSTSGFISGPTHKNNELSILSFEVANTIVKGSTLMQSLTKRSIRVLEDSVLPEKSIQRLISKDIDQLLKIVASDKREELKVFSEEVIRFGNRCKDPQWHNLNRFFEKRSRDRTPQKQLMDTAESEMQQLMNLVQLTAELYQELHVLDKLQQDHRHKRLEELKNATQRGDRDNGLAILASELKSQKKLVKSLNKRSLWSKSMEEVMEKLVNIMLFLNQEINNTFGNPDETPEEGSLKLGPSGLALHYANIIIQIDTIVARSSSMTQTSRNTLYESLPPHVKASFRSQLKSFHVEKELTVTEIKDEMEKTLNWLVSIATNTIKAHHGFGWVGEWANTGSDLNRRTVGPNDVMQIETLHHADKQKTEAYIIDLLLWLNHLIIRSKAGAKGSGIVKPLNITPASSPIKEDDKQTNTENDTILSTYLIRADPIQELNDTREEKEAEKLDKTRENAATGVETHG